MCVLIEKNNNNNKTKVLKHVDREALYKTLTEARGVCWATCEVGSRRIDEINILEATKEAMTVNARLETLSVDDARSSAPTMMCYYEDQTRLSQAPSNYYVHSIKCYCM